MKKRMYLSFAAADGWLGFVIAEGETLEEVILETHARKCNPGGEIAALVFKNYDMSGMEASEWLAKQPMWTLIKTPPPGFASSYDMTVDQLRKISKVTRIVEQD